MAVAHPELLWVVIISGVTCALLAISIGANDVANAFSASIGSGSLKLHGAILIAFVFEILGASMLGGTVSDAIRTRVLNFKIFQDSPHELAMGMFSASIGAAAWIVVSTYFGMPVSTTHSIIGALAGFGVASGRVDSVHWVYILYIVLSWFAVPLVAIVVSTVIYILLQEVILKWNSSFKIIYNFHWLLLIVTSIPLAVFLTYENPLMKVKEPGELLSRYIEWFKSSAVNRLTVFAPVLASLVIISCLFTYGFSYRRLKSNWSYIEAQNSVLHLEIVDANRNLSSNNNRSEHSVYSMEINVGNDRVGVKMVDPHPTSSKSGMDLLRTPIDKDTLLLSDAFRQSNLNKTETVFSVMQIVCSTMVILSHSANDTANAVTPFVTTFFLYYNGVDDLIDATPWYVLFVCGSCMALGLATFGYKVIKTVGLKLTKVTPSRGYVIDTTSSCLVLILSHMGIPLSSTHCSVSSILGVGLVENVKNQDHIPADSNTRDIEGDGTIAEQENFLKEWFPFVKRLTTRNVSFKLYRKIFFSWLTTVFFSGLSIY